MCIFKNKKENKKESHIEISTEFSPIRILTVLDGDEVFDSPNFIPDMSFYFLFQYNKNINLDELKNKIYVSDFTSILTSNNVDDLKIIKLKYDKSRFNLYYEDDNCFVLELAYNL